MLQSALHRILRIFLVTLGFWFNTDIPTSQVDRSDLGGNLYRGVPWFKAGLETQDRILRNTSEGVNRIKDVRKELISLSHQAERIKEAAFEMVDETPDSVHVRNATPEWLSSRLGDPQLEEVCISMEYSLDRLAFELDATRQSTLWSPGTLSK